MSDGKRLDWTLARTRLARVLEAKSSAAELPSEEERAMVLRRRAELLARPAQTSDQSSAGDMLMVFGIGGERYGLPVSDVVQVIAQAKLTPVPGAPAEIAGVIQVRGEVRAVYDLRALLELEREEAPRRAAMVILLHRDGREFGAMVDHVEDIRVDGREARLPPIAGSKCVLWTTRDLVSVLDLNRLWPEKKG